MGEPTTLGHGQYAGWRATPLGAIPERLALGLVFDSAGPLRRNSVLDVNTRDGSYALETASRGAVVTGVDVASETSGLLLHPLLVWMSSRLHFWSMSRWHRLS